jgi:hypothetical protein
MILFAYDSLLFSYILFHILYNPLRYLNIEFFLLAFNSLSHLNIYLSSCLCYTFNCLSPLYLLPAVMIGCLVADVKDVSELAPLLFVPQLLFAGDIPPPLTIISIPPSNYLLLHPSLSLPF